MFPKLRFKEFDGDWLPYVLKDFVSFRKGKGISKADISEDGINECIRYGELYTTYGQVIRKVQSKTYVSKSECVLSQAGDVLIPASGETQIDIATASCVLKGDVILSGDLNILSHKENGEWLAYYLSSAKKLDIAQLAQGNSVVHLYSSQLKDLKINKPSKAEQTKIVTFLSAVDEKISQLTQKHELLSQYKQGMMQKLFSQQIRFKADDGSAFGEWDQSELKEVAQINPKVKKLPENFIYIDLESVEKGLLLLEKNITLSEAPSRAQRLLSKGDVLFQMVRPYQQNNYYFNLDGQYVASTGYAQIRTELNSKFIYYALHEKSFLDEVMNRCTGTSYPAINSSDLSTIEIGIPCLEEQTKIANFLSAIDQKIEVVAQQIEQAKTWKKGLLQQIFV
ncbi:restriction endonuclease subunit S [Acinetobacter towneri]|nr:restriction endonuclease subunit S [Acinetobacter towneri]MDV2485685.1 restriction endonuclease subunit S [Acinetobacter towneri]